MKRYVRAYYDCMGERFYLTDDPDNDTLSHKKAYLFEESYFDEFLADMDFVKEPLSEAENLAMAGVVGLPLVFD
jgi:hypothetical protein